MSIAQIVRGIFDDCLFMDGEDVAGAIIVDGVIAKFGLHPGRVASHASGIADIVRRVASDDHMRNGGGGASFLALCVDREGNHWGEHTSMQELCVLAIAAGIGKWCAPRSIWPILPGGMPYVVFALPEAAS